MKEEPPLLRSRLFVAVPIPEPLKAEIEKVQAALRACVPKGSYVRPQAMHVTIRFLGDVDPARIPGLVTALDTTLSSIEPFELRVAGGGSFPPGRPPRVLWLGISEIGRERALDRLATQVESAVLSQGLPRADHPFSPHLTLCRTSGPGLHEPPALLQALGELGCFQVKEVVLFQSELLPQGARHTAQARIRLTRASRD